MTESSCCSIGSRTKLSPAKALLVLLRNLLVSREPLPEGDGYNLVVQVRANAEAKPQNFRFAFLNHICLGECENPEYACTCDE